MTPSVVSAVAKTPRERLPRDERRRQIVEAATELFQRRSYDDVSLDEIAEHLGVTRALINHHFGTKRDLYLEIVRQVVSVDQIPIPDYVHGVTLTERVTDSLDRWLDQIENSPDVYLASVQARGIGGRDVAEIIERAREEAADRFIAVLGLGPEDEVSPQERGIIRSWAGLAEAATLQWLEYGRLDRQLVRDLVVDVAVRGATQIFDDRSRSTRPHQKARSKR